MCYVIRRNVLLHQLVAVLSLLALFHSVANASDVRDRVLLRSVETITLHSDKYSSSRRSSRIPQLKCVGGSAEYDQALHPTSVQCYNRGYDGQDVQWECKAELSSEVKFGRLAVNCEGYDSPNDPYILLGSCGLEYELEFTDRKRSRSTIDDWSSYARRKRTVERLHSWVSKPSGGFLILCLLASAVGIWFFCLRTTAYHRLYPSAPPDSAYEYAPTISPNDFCDEVPPDYETACRESSYHAYPRPSQSATPTYGWNVPPLSTHQRSSRFSKTSPANSSWTSNLLSGGLGALGGYLLGSATNSRSTTHYANTAPRNNWEHDSRRSRSPSPNRTVTGFAQTTRR